MRVEAIKIVMGNAPSIDGRWMDRLVLILLYDDCDQKIAQVVDTTRIF